MQGSFTASAERVMIRAGNLAESRGGRAVDSLDLLLALMLETESRAVQNLRESGFDEQAVVDQIQLDQGLDDQATALDRELEGEPLPHSPELRAVLSDAAVHARGLDRTREVGTEHLLAGLISSSPTAAAALSPGKPERLGLLRERLEADSVAAMAPLPLADGIAPLDLGDPDGGADVGRILDASANRAREGLRVVEDYVRFVLADPAITRRLKEVRHRLAQAERGLDPTLLVESRDASSDVGAHIMTDTERLRENPRAVLAANFKRIQESLRSLEEYSKLVDVWLAGRFEVIRYDVYTIEKLTMTAVSARRTLGESQLMVLVGGLPTLGDLEWVVSEAIAGGADVIQLREKGLGDREFLSRARDVRIMTARAGVVLIVNDRPDLALLARADGVHLGQDDITMRDARRVLGPTAVVGISTHARDQLDAALLEGAGYLGVGPVFPSPTKEFSEPELAGLAFVEHAAQTTTRPWFAIGGITEDNLDRVLAAGATRVAVSSAVIRSDRPRRAVERMKARLAGLQAVPLVDGHDSPR